jgi:uncharacterized protein YecT (DUF1311 family)
MPSDRTGEPWTEYNGFAAEPVTPPPRRRLRLPPLTGRNIAFGTAGAVALGILGGLLLRPDLDSKGFDKAEAAAPAVPIEVNRPQPLPTPKAAGKLEVLSPDQVAAARANAAPPAPSYAPAPQAYLPSAPPPLPRVEAAPITAPPAVRQPPPLAAPQVAANCAGARSQAEAMVCGDPDLAAADRELNRAYRRALQSGAAPPGALRADQRDWLAIREDAAQHSRRALSQVYRQRIEELNNIARDGSEDGPGF